MVKKSPAVRVLVVDDEPLIRWSLTQALEERGCLVTEAPDGRSAVRAFNDALLPFDVVLLDLRLPDSNDLGVLSRLRQLEPASRVILMTAFGAPEVVQDALDMGAFRVMTKPFELGEVAALVHQAHQAAQQ